MVHSDGAILLEPESPFKIRLASRAENPGTTAYIAVSYCWRQTKGATEPKFEIESEHGYRPNKAPGDILYRAISYALRHDIRFIWIDQECIEQDDPNDQTVGIQAMDLVYARSEHPIGMLAVPRPSPTTEGIFNTLHDAKSLGHKEFLTFCQNSFSNTAIKNAVSFLDQVQQDLWFTRAWIYQESSCGYECMVLLVRETMANTSILRSSSGPEIHFKQLTRWVNGLSQTLENGMYATATDSFYGEAPNYQNITNKSLRLLWQGHPHRTAFRVLIEMNNKDNLIVSDRLVIIANCCQYSHRLDVPAVEQAGHHFSVCALTLAIINGDVNPWPESQGEENRGMGWVGQIDRPNIRPHSCDTPTRKVNTLGEDLINFVDIWNRHLGTRDDIPDAPSPRLPGVTLNMVGFQTRGWLWYVVPGYTFGGGAVLGGSTAGKRFVEALDAQLPVSDLIPVLNDFCLHLVWLLQIPLVKGIRNTLIKTLGGAIAGGPADEAFNDRRLLAESGYVFPLVERVAEAPWLLRHMEQIARTSTLSCGKLTKTGSDLDGEFTALFPCSNAAMIFTSTDQDLDVLAKQSPLGLSNFYSVEVLGGADVSPKPLIYGGSWNRGVWYASRADMQVFSFPWGQKAPREPVSTCRGGINWKLAMENLGGPNDTVLFARGI
jgi:hypothetical protein